MVGSYLVLLIVSLLVGFLLTGLLDCSHSGLYYFSVGIVVGIAVGIVVGLAVIIMGVGASCPTSFKEVGQFAHY